MYRPNSRRALVLSEAPIFPRPLTRVRLVPLRANLPTFFDIWKEHPFHTGALSIQAKVLPGTIIAMLYSNRVPRGDAEKVLAKISEISGRKYTLSTVSVPVIEKNYEQDL
jgi:hypothetical protein